ncbi:DUF6302 family protein [Streptomyces sp. NPDC048665]|uniref:DUF6302 family protein n=1 Tax=Streptomyces sp. NPDC048665 TaxID=3155490 RepID=UPI00343B3A4D
MIPMVEVLPRVDVLPPGEAYDYDYFRTRVDERLVASSIALRVYRMPFLAVPAGGSRRGGYFPVDGPAAALAVRDALEPYNGFPALRARWLPAPVNSFATEWGDPPPDYWTNADERLAFYGLTGLGALPPLTPLSPVTCGSAAASWTGEEGPIVSVRARPRGRASCVGTLPVDPPLTRTIA